MSAPTKLIGSIDQGTSSSRFLVFRPGCHDDFVLQAQKPVKSIYPNEGWFEQDPMELLQSVIDCMKEVSDQLKELGEVVAIGLTNQRETTVVWDRHTGLPLYNAIVWCDGRTSETVTKMTAKANGDENAFKEKTGLPINGYFSALKFCWLLDNVPEVKSAVQDGRALFGTVDAWLIWKLTGKHLTDVTNASRTMLMNIKTCKWDDELCSFFGVPTNILPEIKSSSEVYGPINGDLPFSGVPIAGCLGDQQAALVGHRGLEHGMAKNTYGTGCFMLFNIGPEIAYSKHGLLTTVAYQFGDEKPVYALEGSIAVAGAAVKWLRDNLKIINEYKEIEELAKNVSDNGGVYFVPAFSGLFAPHWRQDARGTICGLTQYSSREHLCRAVLEAVSFQTREILESMELDSGHPFSKLLVDGGMTQNDLLMQIQADILGIETVRPCMPETTVLGAAIAAGRAVGLWDVGPAGRKSDTRATKFVPELQLEVRNERFRKWKMAVERCKGWEEN